MSITNKALTEYSNTNISIEANGYQVVKMLLEGILSKVTRAKVAIQNKDIASRGENVGAVIVIIGALKGSLDLEKGGDIAQNLDALYAYMTRRLLEVSLKNDIEVLDEVHQLISTIKSGWDNMQPESNKE